MSLGEKPIVIAFGADPGDLNASNARLRELPAIPLPQIEVIPIVNKVSVEL